ncbi:protein of unknown function DUF402 [Thermobaculum terrenum ATCC BAA-798]|uniref:DUF402 domain-containing protein n=1 Tax=Thermobaculum terrenum (strain ATCC BAA-798 / CCMEE 7001 / YNP1) TaxID=525904 RepID=D1CHK3_THET1|nr:protein of unknown function DUF402 [Thermobaculum terrenum ATCC BAA-798]
MKGDYRPVGTPVILRSVRSVGDHLRVGFVRSFTVVEHESELLVLYIAPGYPCKRPVGVRGGPKGRILLKHLGRYEDWEWRDTRMLLLYRQGDAHSIQLFWRNEEFLEWYIDLHAPLRITSLGWDTSDFVLDLQVAPDFSSWSWKDEDELEFCVQLGRYNHAQVEAIRREGELALTRLRQDRLYYQRWIGWRPDSSWLLPSIPEGWELVNPELCQADECG